MIWCPLNLEIAILTNNENMIAVMKLKPWAHLPSGRKIIDTLTAQVSKPCLKLITVDANSIGNMGMVPVGR